MLRITINYKKILKLLEKVPADIEITSLDITNVGGKKTADTATCEVFATWIYDLVQHTNGPIRYNLKLIDKKHIRSYKS